MKKHLLILLIVALIGACSEPRDSLLDVGIPLKMAQYRKEQLSSIQYQLTFDIPATLDEPVPARLLLDLEVQDLRHPLYLDFNAPDSLLKKLTVNGQSAAILHRLEHLIIDQELLKPGKNEIEIVFDAGEQSLNRNEEFLYTLLVPDRASTLFPCFDQPNLKAVYQLNISVPQGWVALAGAPVQQLQELDGRMAYTFEESEPMSTYLFSFVAGQFQSTRDTGIDGNMEMLFRENDSTKIAWSVPQVLKHHAEALAFLEDYTQYPFPFKKMDFAAIPGFQYGGMEHVGAIQYRESALFLDESATQSRKLSRAKLIAHETAHMWFGDLVTMDWFSDVWLKEVFANFMADKIMNPAFPEINHSLNFFTSHYASAYSEDRTQGSNPIRQPLDNLKNAGTLYGRIIYNKAPIMMRQLETLVGEEAFREGIREYMQAFAYDNATWNDLVTILDAKTETNLPQWSEVWVNQAGRPVIEAAVSFEQEAIASFTLTQQAEKGNQLVWPQVFSVDLVYDEEVKSISVPLDQKTILLEEAVGLTRPKAIIYNADGYGYGVFPVDEGSLELISTLTDEVARASAYTNVYENILSGNMPSEKGIDLYLEGLEVEQNELVLALLTAKLGHLYWHYLSPAQRTQYQPRLEKGLQMNLLSELPASHKKVLFGLYKGIAYSESGKSFLYAIWSRTESIADLKLNQDDYTSLAMTLAMYEHPESTQILAQAKSEISNPDQLQRFEFMVPVLSEDEKVRDAFFTSLATAKNREKESWVLSACQYMHHPLRQESSQKHLRLSLDLLQEIQLTGDIFFPKRWLVATIGQYQSEYAYQELQKFLQEQPAYNEVLKKKLLQASDDLIRYQEMN